MPEAAGTEYVTLGRVIGLFGVRGWVKVHSDTNPRDNIVNYSRWWLRESNAWRLVDVVQGKRQGKTVVAQLKGVENRDQAARLMGCDIAVTRADLPALQAGEYYWTDLIGAAVVDDEGVSLGLVERLFETGANDVMVVRGEGPARSEMLIPWVLPSVITQVDLQQRRITVDWDPDY